MWQVVRQGSRTLRTPRPQVESPACRMRHHPSQPKVRQPAGGTMVVDQTGLKLWWDVHILRRAANANSYAATQHGLPSSTTGGELSTGLHPSTLDAGRSNREGASVHPRQPISVGGDLSPEDLACLFSEGEARLRGGSDTKFVLDTSQP